MELTKKDRQRLRDMVAATRADRNVVFGLDDVEESLRRLERVAGFSSRPFGSESR